MTIEQIERRITDSAQKAFQKIFGKKDSEPRLVYPPDVSLGDFSLECFALAEKNGLKPDELAQKLSREIETDDLIVKTEAVGPYLNIFVSRPFLFKEVCKEILEKGKDFGKNKSGRGKKVMVEYLSPNTNKPLHVGHSRNAALGIAVSNLFEFASWKVIKANLVNDRGVHICKSMLAWEKWANGQTPESADRKEDHFVGDWYVRYGREAEKNPGLEQEIKEMLKKWEEGDSETVRLWKTMNEWVYRGFEETYKTFGIEFDKTYYESKTYKLGKNLVQLGLKKGIFSREENGAVVISLKPEEFGLDKEGNIKRITLLRPDGTSVYMTQDLGTAELRFKDFDLDKSIYIVGKEQDYHLKILFHLLKLLGFKWADSLYHLSCGMVLLPSGRMKSREGKVVDLDDLIEEVRQLAVKEILKRDPDKNLSEKEVGEESLKIALGAIKFYLLRVQPKADITFNPEESISFDGFTGPYCQYAYARCKSIERKAKEAKVSEKNVDFGLLGAKEEIELILSLMKFSEEAESSLGEYNPSRLCAYVFSLAQNFSRFYNSHPVLSAETKNLAAARLALVRATAQVIKNCLALLGIEALEEM